MIMSNTILVKNGLDLADPSITNDYESRPFVLIFELNTRWQFSFFFLEAAFTMVGSDCIFFANFQSGLQITYFESVLGKFFLFVNIHLRHVPLAHIQIA